MHPSIMRDTFNPEFPRRTWHLQSQLGAWFQAGGDLYRKVCTGLWRVRPLRKKEGLTPYHQLNLEAFH
jgi:hypothetical protein